MRNKKILVVVTGALLGFTSVALVALGNPANMGMCIACFLRDITGGLGLHRAPVVQYIRPEIIGLVLGAFGSALITRDYRVLGGSATFTRFFLGFMAMTGMLVFLGCPVRAVLRLAAGDLNAGVAILGLICGILVGVEFLKRGFSLGRAVPQPRVNGYIFPTLVLACLVLLLVRAPFIFFSVEGPGSQHAPVFVSLAAGLLIGVFAQRSRFCMIGGIRDFIFFKDTHLLSGFISLLIAALIGNLVLGTFKLGFEGQPIAHTDGVWNFLGMVLAGWAMVLLGGCPLRQLVAAAEGNTDCAATVTGIMAGAAFAHNFGLAASPKGVPLAGQVAVVLFLLVVFVISVFNLPARERKSDGLERNQPA